LLTELISHLRQNRTELREEWARRITESRLLTAMTQEKIFIEAAAAYDNYVAVLETGLGRSVTGVRHSGRKFRAGTRTYHRQQQEAIRELSRPIEEAERLLGLPDLPLGGLTAGR
jgi:hypothetical protein